MPLYKYQREAIKKTHEYLLYVVTIGIGSGKSLSYLIPLFYSILIRDRAPKVTAIILYPMNALVNSQYSILKK
ncbi:MAG: DEAD/DEAH box helicase [Methanomicrobiales archaeon]|nr:DEAD/DEAH box helicase [Methanomicrobiales archaeon]